ncbi:hypothetical protein GCM10007100_25020 [Roseibacillus persicicus]|uniref:SLA1 homology domain-containing protein n=1 Tax=Roseibacillus persicicus TaxID=454148 RepID=A0A918TP79_9BACT|nr:hypothetical protein GCM10007100_25020 [Roseibacillus persicicus]
MVGGVKVRSLCFFSCLAFASVGVSEERTFRTIHQTVSFEGEAVGFDPDANTVTIRREGGREVKYQLSFLSKEDQSYIQKHRETLILAASIQIGLTEVAGEAKAAEAKDGEATKPVGFTISVQNSAEVVRKGLNAEYTLYYRKGLKAGMGPILQKSGRISLGDIHPGKSVSASTAAVDLAREEELGDDCCSGRVMPGGGWPDMLLGCKIELKVDGEVVKAYYSKGNLPALLAEE